MWWTGTCKACQGPYQAQVILSRPPSYLVPSYNSWPYLSTYSTRNGISWLSNHFSYPYMQVVSSDITSYLCQFDLFVSVISSSPILINWVTLPISLQNDLLHHRFNSGFSFSPNQSPYLILLPSLFSFERFIFFVIRIFPGIHSYWGHVLLDVYQPIDVFVFGKNDVIKGL